MFRKTVVAVLFILFGNLARADVQPMPDATRAELLYSTHCIACHSARMHWRDRKLATDWASLQAEVRRWQEMSALGWSDEDIAEVTRYLNARHYHYAAPD